MFAPRFTTVLLLLVGLLFTLASAAPATNDNKRRGEALPGAVEGRRMERRTVTTVTTTRTTLNVAPSSSGTGGEMWNIGGM